MKKLIFLFSLIFVFCQCSKSLNEPGMDTKQRFNSQSVLNTNLKTKAEVADNKNASFDFKEWVFSKATSLIEKAGNDLLDKIENLDIGELLWDKLLDSVTQKFGDVISKSISQYLGQFISFGPFINLNFVLNIGRKSDSQVITEVILKAIEQCRSDILNAIDQQYVGQMTDILNALLNTYQIHNARTDLEMRFTDDWPMEYYLTKAEEVFAAFEGSMAQKVKNLHFYMLLMGNYIQVLTEDGQFDYLKAYLDRWGVSSIGQMTAVQIQNALASSHGKTIMTNDFLQRFKVRLQTALNHVANLSVNTWKTVSNDRFSNNNIQFVSRTNVPSSEWNRYKYEILAEYERNYPISYMDKWVYKYKVMGEDVRIKIIEMRLRDNANKWITLAELHDAYGERSVAYEILCDWFSITYKGFVEQARQRHMKRSYFQFFYNGYNPIKEMLDTWYQLAGYSSSRPENNLDLHLKKVKNNVFQDSWKWHNVWVNYYKTKALSAGNSSMVSTCNSALNAINSKITQLQYNIDNNIDNNIRGALDGEFDYIYNQF